MHVHLPKPLHGWRAFIGEVGIIVLGVLIALAAEQIVVFLHDRNVASQAEADIRAELAYDTALAAERVAIGDCQRASLTDLRQRLIASGDSWPGLGNTALPRNATGTIMGTLHAFPRPFRTLGRLWRNTAWASATSTGALNPIPRSDFADLAELYVMEGLLDRFQDRQVDDEANLMPLTIAQTLDPAARLQLLTVLSKADADNANTERLAANFVTAARQSGILPDRKWLDRHLPLQARTRGRCVRQGRALDRAVATEGAVQR